MYVDSQEKAEEIRRIIKKLREEKGISQREMATKMGMNSGSYNRIENGPYGLKLDAILQAAAILDVEPASLLGESSEEFNALWQKYQSLSPERQARLKAQIEDLILAQSAESKQAEE